MPRGKKVTASVLRCADCNRENYSLYLSNKKEQRPEEFKKYCRTCKKRTEHKTKDAKSSKKK